MGSGEWISMRAQRELLERELAMEKHEIRHRPEGERRELVGIYENRGVDPSVAFGDADMETLYITARTSVYRVRLGVKGALSY